MDNDFAYAIEKSTKASWSGSLYHVELFSDGSYRVFNDSADPDTREQQIGSFVFDVPFFEDEDYLEEVRRIGKNDFIGDDLIDLVKFDSLYAIEDAFLDSVYERISNVV
jgi:hypothetical protein